MKERRGEESIKFIGVWYRSVCDCVMCVCVSYWFPVNANSVVIRWLIHTLGLCYVM